MVSKLDVEEVKRLYLCLSDALTATWRVWVVTCWKKVIHCAISSGWSNLAIATAVEQRKEEVRCFQMQYRTSSSLAVEWTGSV